MPGARSSGTPDSRGDRAASEPNLRAALLRSRSFCRRQGELDDAPGGLRGTQPHVLTGAERRQTGTSGKLNEDQIRKLRQDLEIAGGNLDIFNELLTELTPGEVCLVEYNRFQ